MRRLVTLVDILRAHEELTRESPHLGSAVSFAAIARRLGATPSQMQQAFDQNGWPRGYEPQRATLPHRDRSYYLKLPSALEYDAGRGWLAAVLVER